MTRNEFNLLYAIKNNGMQSYRNLSALSRASLGYISDAVKNFTALGYIDECCLGYTFYKKDEGAFKSSCDGVAIYFQNIKHLLKSALVTSLLVAVLSFVAWLLPFAIIALIFSALNKV